MLQALGLKKYLTFMYFRELIFSLMMECRKRLSQMDGKGRTDCTQWGLHEGVFLVQHATRLKLLKTLPINGRLQRAFRSMSLG